MARVSIITVAKNNEAGLEATYRSVLKQSFTDWQMVIVVAESSDNTVAVAKKFESLDSRITLINQTGFGIYGAMNEGLAVASGEFTWFMNSGDIFASNLVLTHAIERIASTGAVIVIGGYQMKNRGKLRVFSFPPCDVKPLNFAFTRRGGCHQAMIFKTQSLLGVGGFDLRYSLASDFDLVIKVMKKANVVRVSEVFAEVEPGGSADLGIFLVHEEKHQIRNRLIGGPVIYICSFIWKTLAKTKIALKVFLNRSAP